MFPKKENKIVLFNLFWYNKHGYFSQINKTWKRRRTKMEQLSKKQFYAQCASKKDKGNIRAAAILGYICAGATLLLGVLMQNYFIIIVIGMVLATPLLSRWFKKLEAKQSNTRSILITLIYIGILILSTASLVSDSYNPFLYFRF